MICRARVSQVQSFQIRARMNEVWASTQNSLRDSRSLKQRQDFEARGCFFFISGMKRSYRRILLLVPYLKKNLKCNNWLWLRFDMLTSNSIQFWFSNSFSFISQVLLPSKIGRFRQKWGQYRCPGTVAKPYKATKKHTILEGARSDTLFKQFYDAKYTPFWLLLEKPYWWHISLDNRLSDNSSSFCNCPSEWE